MPPSQLAQVASWTPGVDLIVSTWPIGMGKIIEVERMVTTRVDELAAATASKPSRTACSEAKRKTAIATLSTVSAVRRRLRRALLRTRFRYFTAAPFQARDAACCSTRV